VTVASAAAEHVSLGLVCPRCRGELASPPDAFECHRCRSRFPVVLGIPDFRLEPDPWIGLEDDREKARRLEKGSRGASLEAMVRTYWSMTPEIPVEQASRFELIVNQRSAKALGLGIPAQLLKSADRVIE